jgi:hypothetical protein
MRIDVATPPRPTNPGPGHPSFWPIFPLIGPGKGLLSPFCANGVRQGELLCVSTSPHLLARPTQAQDIRLLGLFFSVIGRGKGLPSSVGANGVRQGEVLCANSHTGFFDLSTTCA